MDEPIAYLGRGLPPGRVVSGSWPPGYEWSAKEHQGRRDCASGVTAALASGSSLDAALEEYLDGWHSASAEDRETAKQITARSLISIPSLDGRELNQYQISWMGTDGIFRLSAVSASPMPHGYDLSLSDLLRYAGRDHSRTVDIQTRQGTVTARVVDAEHIWVSIADGTAYWEQRMSWEDGALVGFAGELSDEDQRELAEAIVEAGLLAAEDK